MDQPEKPTTMIDVLKSDTGSLAALGRSKKYALTAAFASTCLVVVGTTASAQIQIAAMICAAATVIAYVLGQSLVEASGVKLIEVDSEITAPSPPAATAVPPPPNPKG